MFIVVYSMNVYFITFSISGVLFASISYYSNPHLDISSIHCLVNSPKSGYGRLWYLSRFFFGILSTDILFKCSYHDSSFHFHYLSHVVTSSSSSIRTQRYFKVGCNIKVKIFFLVYVSILIKINVIMFLTNSQVLVLPCIDL